MLKNMLPHVFDRPIAFHRILAEVAGSVNGGVFLSQAMYWSNVKAAADGWFYKTSQDWEAETFLSRREQETVRRQLVRVKVLEEKRSGIPAKLYFRINNDVLLEKLREIVKTRMAENANQYVTNPPDSHGEIRTSNTETTSETTSETTQDISYDQDFAEFWSTYPKRPNNSKAAAKKKYILARKRGVPHVIIMAGVRDYAAARNKAVADGDSLTYTQMAETWLNKECWENDYNPPADVKKEPVATDGELFDLAAEYPGHIGSYGVAQKLLADELSKGATIEALCEAARKYKLFCKGPPYEDRKIAPAMLEQWLKFKWREMDGYEFCTVGPDRIKTVRPKKANV